MFQMKRKQVEKNCKSESEKNVRLIPYISIPGCRDDNLDHKKVDRSIITEAIVSRKRSIYTTLLIN